MAASNNQGPTNIKPEDAGLAGEKGIVVVTTACLALRMKQQSELSVQRKLPKNLQDEPTVPPLLTK
ncbi:hypothetical protein L0222_18010 [bacterium]|nr:hypothetical protein [bacterium]